jgi:acetyltransferase-like isoleucine patch superfamily enzyme
MTKATQMRSLLKRCRDFAMCKRPFGLSHLGAGSAIEWPRKMESRPSIYVGSRTLIRSHAAMEPVLEYSGRRYKPTIHIGDDVYIGRHVYLTACDKIVISNGCVLSEHVYMSDSAHGFDPLRGLIMKQPLESRGGILLGPNCFLGYRVTILPGVELGEWCIVGANSVVTRSFPAYSMIAGAPATVVKVYSHDLQKWVKPLKGSEKVQHES